MAIAHKPNAQYNVAEPTSLSVRIAGQARRRMYDLFIERTSIQPFETLLDVGVTSDQTYESSNYVEAWYPYKDRITAVGIDDASFLEQQYPGLTYRRADGRRLPFTDAELRRRPLERRARARRKRGEPAKLHRRAYAGREARRLFDHSEPVVPGRVP